MGAISERYICQYVHLSIAKQLNTYTYAVYTKIWLVFVTLVAKEIVNLM